jgi:hypothetical protein
LSLIDKVRKKIRNHNMHRRKMLKMTQRHTAKKNVGVQVTTSAQWYPDRQRDALRCG